MKLTVDELNVLMNSWPEGTQGWSQDRRAIELLDDLGRLLGYGALAQVAQWLCEAQCHKDQSKAAALKRDRFKALGWKLPANFEWVARKHLHHGPEDLS